MIFCNLYVFLDVLLCTTSIWHLTIVSIDHFLYTSRPFRSRERSKFKTFFIIILTKIFHKIIAVSSHSSRQLYLNKRNIMAEPLICPLCNSIIGNSIDGIAIYACGHMIHGECFYDLHHQKQIDTVANITLNTCSIGRTNSMFIPYIFNITNSCLKL
ncbi:unnamed protein product [Rotaria sordida]|uniref:G-protein coupled receptors family 1 profile domain-containing protein n=1 Tax=Rotaria sordida TaxID=392033 RepID=A0A814YUD3_9BILA|nr:unnamed protein product [Rotaria sordida]